MNTISKTNSALMQKWSKRIALVEKVQGKPLSVDRKNALAATLENTQSLLEATQVQGIGGNAGSYKRWALDLVTASVPNTIMYDFVSVQPMNNRVGMINYVKYSYGTNKGQTQAGQTFMTALNAGQSDMNYTAEDVVDEVVALDGGKANLAWVPVAPGTVKIACDAGEITDDGAGNLAGAATGTIDYASGAISLTGSVDNPIATYVYNNKFAPAAVPEVQLSIESLPVVAKDRTIKSLYSLSAALQFEKEYGEQVDSLMAAEVAGELAHEVDMEVCSDLLTQAEGSNIAWNKAQPTAISLLDHYDSFYARLLEGSNIIFQNTRKVRANFLVCGLGVANIISAARNFVPSGQAGIGPHLLGTYGQFTVYVAPDYPANEYVMGYRGTGLFDAGYVFCPFIPITPSDLLRTDDLVGRRAWMMSYGKRMINRSMYCKGAVIS